MFSPSPNRHAEIVLRRALRRQVEAELRTAGLSEPVDVLPPMPSVAEMLAGYVCPFTIDKPANAPSIWRYQSRRGKTWYKVQRKANDQVTCGCPAYRKNREDGCDHTADYCIQNGLPIPTCFVGNKSRRLAPMTTIYPSGRASSTRRNRAYRKMDGRVCDLAFELVKDLDDAERRNWWQAKEFKLKRRPQTPFRALMYALLVKLALGKSYYQLDDFLRDDARMKKLNPKGGVPNWNTLCELTAQPFVQEILREILRRTARPGRNIDYALAIDGTGFGTCMLDHWFAEKYGKKEIDPETVGDDQDDSDAPELPDGADETDAAEVDEDLAEEIDPDADESATVPTAKPDKPKTKSSKKSKRKTFLKAHTAMGAQTSLIYAINVTTQYGEGTADTRHFESLLMESIDLGNFEIVVADKAYYTKANFEFAQSKGKLFFALKKKGVKISNVERCRELMAFMRALQMRHRDVFRRFYRLRAKIESIFSAQKRTGRQIRLQIRHDEYARLSALTSPPKTADIETVIQVGEDPQVAVPMVNADGKSTFTKIWDVIPILEVVDIKDTVPPKLLEQLDKLRKEVCRLMAMKRVGYAQTNETLGRAIGYNLRTLVRLEQRHDEDVDFAADKAFKHIRRVSLPKAA